MKRFSHVVAAAALLVMPASSMLAQTIYVTGSGPIAIPDNTGTLAACQSINVPDSVIISDVNVEFTAEHSWVGDLTFRLMSPASTMLTLVNRPGRTGTGAGFSDDYITSVPIILNDTGNAMFPAERIGDDTLGCTSGDIDGTGGCPTVYMPAPDTSDTPIGGVGTNLADFNGENSLGTWMLCVGDSAGGDTGTLTSWRLGINLASDPMTSLPVELQSFSVE